MKKNIRVAILPGVIALLLVPLVLPWLVVNSQGRFEFTVFDAIRGLANNHGASPLGFRFGDFSSFISIYKDTYMAFGFAMMFYAMSIGFAVLAAALKDSRKAFLGPCGVSAIASVVAWIFGIESLKSHILTDGQLSAAYTGQINGFFNSVVTPGIGPFIVIGGGILALAAYSMKETPVEDLNEGVEQDTVMDEDVEEVAAKSVESTNPNPKSARPHDDEDLLPEKPVIINRIVYKSSGTAALLAFIGAIFGFLGIGHIYVGRVGRGLLILISGFLLYAFMWLSIFGGIFGAVFGGPNGSVPALQTGFSLASVLVLLYFGLLIWQILDARSLAKKVNEHVMLTGKEPW